PPPRRPRPPRPRPPPPRSRRFSSMGGLGGASVPAGWLASGRAGISSMRGLKFGSTSTTPIFGISGGAARGPREPRRKRALGVGTVELDHRVTQLVRAHGLIAAAEPGQGLFEQAERVAEREPSGPPAAALFMPAARSAGPILPLARRWGPADGRLRCGTGHA